MNKIFAVKLPNIYVPVMDVNKVTFSPGKSTLWGYSLLYSWTGLAQHEHFIKLLTQWINVPMLWGQLVEIPIPNTDYIRMRTPVIPPSPPVFEKNMLLNAVYFDPFVQYSATFNTSQIEFPFFRELWR